MNMHLLGKYLSISFSNAICYLEQFTLNTDFLHTVVSVEAAIIAIAFPLASEIIGRISERYGSDSISKGFSNCDAFKLLPVVTLLHIAFSCTLLFLIDSDKKLNGIQIIFLWINFLTFVFVVTVVFYKFLRVAKKYIESRNSIIKDLFKDTDEFLKIKGKRNRYLQSIKGIGDILCYEVKNGNNQFVYPHLFSLKNVILEVFKYQENDPNKFEAIIKSPELDEVRNDSLANFRLVHEPEKYLGVVATPVEQLDRICKAAIGHKNLEICDEIMGIWRDVLSKIVLLKDDSLLLPFANIILQKIDRINENENLRYFESDNLLSDWYLEPVFFTDKKGEEQDKWVFNFTFLHWFNLYFFQFLELLIRKNRIEQFERCIQHIAMDEYLRPEKNAHYDDDFPNVKLESNERKEYVGLTKRIEYISGQRQAARWHKDFIKVTNPQTHPRLNDEKNIQVIIKKELNYFARRFRYNRLQRLLFSTGAYCLKEKKLDFLKCILSYRKLQYSDNSVVKTPIIPENFNDLGSFWGFVFGWEKAQLFKEDVLTYSGKEGSEKKYLLCLTLHVLKKASDGSMSSSLDGICKENIHKSLNELHEIGEEISKDTDLRNILELDKDLLQELTSFLNKLRIMEK